VSFSQLKPRSKISLSAMRTFEAAARHKSMTDAASELSVTPGAVSRQIADLQRTLSFELYEGHSNARCITKEGLELASTLTRAFDEIDSTLLKLDSAKNRYLDVSCLSTSAPRPANRSTNRLDVSIIIQSPNESLSEHDTELFCEDLGPVIKPELIKNSCIYEPNDLLNFAALTSRTRPNVWKDWESKLVNQSNTTLSKISVFDHLSLAIEASVNGLGFCVTPKHLVDADIASDRLAAPLGFKRSGYTYTARAHGKHKAKSKIFIEWLKLEASTCSAAALPAW